MVHLVKVSGGYELAFYLGLKPLSVPRLSGILTSPFVHGDWGHLLNNSLSFAGLGFFLFFFYYKIALKSFFQIYILTGIGVWLFGKEAFHIGASGIIYGMVALLFWLGIFRRNVRSIAISLVILTLYSGMFYGLLPKEHVSYESHIIGAVAGIFAAYYYKDEYEDDEKPRTILSADAPEKFFLPRDIFEKTKLERYLEEQRNQSEQDIIHDE